MIALPFIAFKVRTLHHLQPKPQTAELAEPPTRCSCSLLPHTRFRSSHRSLCFPTGHPTGLTSHRQGRGRRARCTAPRGSRPWYCGRWFGGVAGGPRLVLQKGDMGVFNVM